jgi:hypothetical protein
MEPGIPLTEPSVAIESKYLHFPLPIRALYGPGFPLFASAWINFVQKPPIFVHGFSEVDDFP